MSSTMERHGNGKPRESNKSLVVIIVCPSLRHDVGALRIRTRRCRATWIAIVCWNHVRRDRRVTRATVSCTRTYVFRPAFWGVRKKKNEQNIKTRAYRGITQDVAIFTVWTVRARCRWNPTYIRTSSGRRRTHDGRHDVQLHGLRALKENGTNRCGFVRVVRKSPCDPRAYGLISLSANVQRVRARVVRTRVRGSRLRGALTKTRENQLFAPRDSDRRGVSPVNPASSSLHYCCGK